MNLQEARSQWLADRPRLEKLGIFFPGQPDAADGAGIDNFLATRLAGGLNHLARAFDIRGIHRRIVAHPQLIVRGDMKTPIAPSQFAGEHRAVGEIARGAFKFQAQQAAFVRPRPQQGFHAMPARDELMDQIRANETRSASDKTFHKAELPTHCKPDTSGISN